MGSLEWPEIWRRLDRVRIPLLILVFALLILCITGKNGSESTSVSQTQNDAKPVTLAEEESRLAETLESIKGVGRARVLLSVRTSAQTDYLADAEKTVILSAGGGKQEALAIRSRSAEYLGAVIVCEGGDDPNTQWNVLEAVSRFTGLRADQITVLKLQD